MPRRKEPAPARVVRARESVVSCSSLCEACCAVHPDAHAWIDQREVTRDEGEEVGDSGSEKVDHRDVGRVQENVGTVFHADRSDQEHVAVACAQRLCAVARIERGSKGWNEWKGVGQHDVPGQLSSTQYVGDLHQRLNIGAESSAQDRGNVRRDDEIVLRADLKNHVRNGAVELCSPIEGEHGTPIWVASLPPRVC